VIDFSMTLTPLIEAYIGGGGAALIAAALAAAAPAFVGAVVAI
jgi:hypothetical protein